MKDLFVPFDPYAKCTILDLVLNARYEVLAPKHRRPAMLRVNYYAAAILDFALSAGSVFFGTVLTPDTIRQVLGALQIVRDHLTDPAAFIALDTFSDTIETLYENLHEDYLVIYRVDKMGSIQDVRIISQHLREELTHWQQNFFGVRGTEGHVIAEDVARHPFWDRIQARLRNLGYTDNLSLLVAEAGAKLAAGSHSELGLSADQGTEFLAHYYLQIVKLHGFGIANQILQFVDRTEVLRLHAIGKTYVSSVG